MNILVSNLASSVTEDDLRTAFSGFGTVIDAIVLRDLRGDSLGRAHIFIVPERAGNQAIETLDKVVLRGQAMKVRQCVYRSKKERRTRNHRWSPADRRRAPERRDSDIDPADGPSEIEFGAAANRFG